MPETKSTPFELSQDFIQNDGFPVNFCLESITINNETLKKYRDEFFSKMNELAKNNKLLPLKKIDHNIK